MSMKEDLGQKKEDFEGGFRSERSNHLHLDEPY